MLYPLKFKPIYKTPLWGGDRIAGLPGRRNVPSGCGESWEISTVEGNTSVVAEGPLKGNTLEELIEVYMGDLVGEQVYRKYGNSFPLLVKIIDAADDLSVQVHPGDEYAAEHHGSYGKTEMWYVMEAEEGSEIINGFNTATTEEEVRTYINNETLPLLLNRVPAQKGDLHFIPSGRVHGIGKGVMLAEIQQASDITYRLYDWARKDGKGNSRPLHIERALDVLDFSSGCTAGHPKAVEGKPMCLSENEYFTANLLKVNGEYRRNYQMLDSFVILLCAGGECNLRYYDNQTMVLKYGSAVLVPACVEEIFFTSHLPCSLIECYSSQL